MKIIQTIDSLKPFLSKERKQGKTVGFVPTMGALHNGHLSLVEQCRKENEICVASIFVNPTQFNDKNDLETYPRTLEKDCEMLKPLGCDYIFAPSEKEMYPEPDTRIFNFGAIAEVMEGRKRPGHFNGVAQIVSKLFDTVAPDNAYFGEKDFQQIAVIRELVRQLGLPVHIVACPIVREADGLAMSSRNMRLTAEQREIAPAIARTLKESCTFVAVKSVKEVEEWVINTLNRLPPLRVEYFEIIDGNTLQPVEDWNETGNPAGCIAVYCDNVRLIDNIKYERPK
jgi:pantoate--beta-alanine ligase